MTRSLYKLPYVAKSLVKSLDSKNLKAKVAQTKTLPIGDCITKTTTEKINNNKIYRDLPINVFQRSSTIIPEMIGLFFLIHSGQRFTNYQVTPQAIGYKFGEFAITKKRALYKRKKKR